MKSGTQPRVRLAEETRDEARLGSDRWGISGAGATFPTSLESPQAQGYSFVVACLFSMHEALSPIPRLKKITT